jgi:hypothetical protein
MYDIFYSCKEKTETYYNLKKRFPLLRISKYESNSFDTFINAQKKSFTNFFWVIDEDFQINDDFNFEYEVEEWDQSYVHLFKNKDGAYSDGIYLIPKSYQISKKEIEYNLFLNTKEINMTAGTYSSTDNALFDIFFISYNEPNADENYERILKRFPYTQRIHGIKGIHNAHLEAAKLSTTKMFWVVDGDAIIEDDFDFEKDAPEWSKNTVYVYRSKNPVNDLIYGYGGVKFLPKGLVLSMDIDTVDMTTSISKRFLSMPKVSNITSFNTDPFNTWRSAFRECVKLSSKVIDNQYDPLTEGWLEVWCTVGIDRPFGEYAIKGAKAGKEFGLKYAQDKEMLKKINDWEWLENEFRC